MGVVAFVLCACVTTVYLLQFRFGAYDLSALIDSGWRVVQGQVPNQDFICTFPPLLYLGAAFAFRVLGVRWLALSVASVSYTFALTLLGMRVLLLMRRRVGDAMVLRLSITFAVLQLIPFFVVGHPWHSSWTIQADLYAFAAAFALLEGESASSRERAELFVHLCAAECLTILGKPNTGMPALVFCTLALLLRSRTRRHALLALLLAIAAASLLMLSAHTSLERQWQVYSHLNSRLIPKNYFASLIFDREPFRGFVRLSVYFALLPAVVWMVQTTLRGVRQRQATPVYVLAAGACLVTILGFGTNAEVPLVDTPPLLFGVGMLAATTWTTSMRLEGVFFYTLCSLLVSATFFGVTRERMQAVGVWADPSCGPLFLWQQDRFFGRFKECAPFFTFLQETDQIVAKRSGARVFFGPRLEFLYARDHFTSPKGLPLWWHPGTSFPLGQEQAVVTAWKASHFDVLLFLHNDRTQIPRGILDEIDHNYVGKTYGPQTSCAPDSAQVDVYTPR